VFVFRVIVRKIFYFKVRKHLLPLGSALAMILKLIMLFAVLPVLLLGNLTPIPDAEERDLQEVLHPTLLLAGAPAEMALRHPSKTYCIRLSYLCKLLAVWHKPGCLRTVRSRVEN
jgi:hypothetical protein